MIVKMGKVQYKYTQQIENFVPSEFDSSVSPELT